MSTSRRASRPATRHGRGRAGRRPGRGATVWRSSPQHEHAMATPPSVAQGQVPAAAVRMAPAGLHDHTPVHEAAQPAQVISISNGCSRAGTAPGARPAIRRRRPGRRSISLLRWASTPTHRKQTPPRDARPAGAGSLEPSGHHSTNGRSSSARRSHRLPQSSPCLGVSPASGNAQSMGGSTLSGRVRASRRRRRGAGR